MGDGRIVDIEVQNSSDDDPQRRVRYYGSVLTANSLKKRKNFKTLPDICMVYISKFDVFKKNLNVYYVNRTINGISEVVYNGYEEVYVNAVCSDTTNDIGQLMQVFVKDKEYNDKFPFTSGLKRTFKETEEGRKEMTDLLEEFYGDQLRAQRKETREKVKKARIQAKMEGQNEIASLCTKLYNENRGEDIKRINEDFEYRKKLLEEMFPQEKKGECPA